MKKWYCDNCGQFENSINKPSIKGCNMAITYAQMRINEGVREVSLPKNHRVHRWYDAEEYINRNGVFESLSELENQFRENERDKNRLNDYVKKQYGNELFLPNGELNEYFRSSNSSRSKEPVQQKNFSESTEEIKKEFSDAFFEIKHTLADTKDQLKKEFSSVFSELKNIIKKLYTYFIFLNAFY